KLIFQICQKLSFGFLSVKTAVGFVFEDAIGWLLIE
ncbi:MAG: hypothetical protein ACI8WW_002242, partial [Oceanospirillaceae bacterium]